MKRAHLAVLLMFSISSALSVFWGFALERTARGIIVDFKVVYYGTRTLIEHHDPYNETELMNVYLAEGGKAPADAIEANKIRQVVALQVYFPTAFLYIAPFALLPWTWAHLLWAGLTIAAFTFASFLMWTLAQDHAPGASFYLISFILANCGILFSGDNPAGLSVALCVVAAWCFLQNRYPWLGVICLAVSLALKPHDSGLVWLYFLLVGGIYRKRALQTLAVAVGMAVPALLWIHSVSPHWLHELFSNLAATSVQGGITDPGPSSVTNRGGGTIIDLQAIFSVFRDDPRLYNSATYLLCGVLLLSWMLITLRKRPTPRNQFFALAFITAFSMLPLYHRPHDAKLLILTLPACAMLFSEGRLIGRIALLLNTAAIVFTSDIPMAILGQATTGANFSTATLRGQLQIIVLTRPAPVLLLLVAVFYLSVYARSPEKRGALAEAAEKPVLVRMARSR